MQPLSTCVVGIDVGGTKKGFHVAAVEVDSFNVLDIRQLSNPDAVVTWIRRLKETPAVIAIDCPRHCKRKGVRVRQAEHDLHRKGYRVQWTRSPAMEEQEWMRNGEELWDNLIGAIPGAVLVETFPTGVSDHLHNCPILIPLQMLQGRANRLHYKDYVDSALCAWAAIRFMAGNAEQFGEDDEQGPIYC